MAKSNAYNNSWMLPLCGQDGFGTNFVVLNGGCQGSPPAADVHPAVATVKQRMLNLENAHERTVEELRLQSRVWTSPSKCIAKVADEIVAA
eukprot:scaffold273675_cov19-Prasinocladus_malaysianus.AAC.1